MHVLTRYLLRQLLLSLMGIGGVVLLALLLIQSLRFLEMTLKTSGVLSPVVRLVLLSIPDLLVITLPVITFAAVLFVYARLFMDKELVSMRAQGYTLMQLARPGLGFAGGVSILAFCLSLWVLPPSFRKLRDVQFEVKAALPSMLLRPGVFHTFGNATVYIHKRSREGELRGIVVYMDRPGERPFTIMADSGALYNRGGKSGFVMLQGTRQEYDPSTKRMTVLHFDKTLVELHDAKAVQRHRPIKPYEMNLEQLLLEPDDASGHTPQRLKAEGFGRLLAPWYALCFGMVGVVLMLLAPFSREFRLSMVVVPTTVVVFLQGAFLALTNMGAHGDLPIAAAYGLLSVVILGGMALLYRGRELRLPWEG